MSRCDDKKIGGRLLGYREKIDLSQGQIAKAIGISLRAYQNYERGERSITKEVICALSDKFGVDPTWLLMGVGTDKDGGNVYDQHPGFYGYLLGKILDKLAQHEALKSYKLSKLGEIALLIYDQIDFNAGYPEQLLLIDEIIAWFVKCVFSTASIESKRDNPDAVKRIFEIAKEEAKEEYRLYCLKCNFDKQSTAYFTQPEEFIRTEIEEMCENAILNGFVCFNPESPKQDFFKSIINLDDFIDLRKSMLNLAKGNLRDEVDKLINQGIEINPEHLTNPTLTGLLQEKIDAKKRDEVKPSSVSKQGDTSVKQIINGENHQIAGRDLINESKK
jgi:transcriptional regulator with XRE-family HTH domain